MSKKIDTNYIVGVLNELEDHPEHIERPTLIAYHAQIGYWLAIADGEREQAEADRKYAEADTMVAAKLGDPKMPAAIVEAQATKAVKPLKDAELKAAARADKLRNLYDTLGKALDGSTVG